MKNVAFVPIKLNSERLENKNIKKFTNGYPLITYILNTLKKVQNIDDIYVYCSDETIVKYLPEGIKYLSRPTYLDLSQTPFIEVLKQFANTVTADNYILTHATAPFISKETIESSINLIMNGSYDSVVGVVKLQEFIWRDGKPINYDINNIPRTQDLPDIFAETCGLYIYNKEVISKNRRIGDNVYLKRLSKLEAIDINTEDDFIIADAIQNSLMKKHNND